MQTTSDHQKPSINIAFLGHCDSGKSTTIGHLLCQYGAFDNDSLDKMKAEIISFGRKSGLYAILLDKIKTESKETSIGTGVRPVSLISDRYQFLIRDTPGNRDYEKDLKANVSQADAIAMIVAATPGEFEAGISFQGQTREHAQLAYTLGVKQMVVCVNKMDDKSVEWSEIRYNEIKNEVSRYLKKIGYDSDKIPFVPISGWTGENLKEKYEKCSWYNGPTLLEAFDSLIPYERSADKLL